MSSHLAPDARASAAGGVRVPASRSEPASAEARIMDATIEALIALDPAALTIQRICREAGVTPPTVYYHFGSKDGLIAAAIERTVADWLQRLDQEVPRQGPVEELIPRAAAAWEEMVLDPRRPLAVFSWATLLTAAGSLQCRDALLHARGRAEAMLDEGLLPLLPDPDARAGLASLIVDALIASALQYHLDSDPAAVRHRLTVLTDTVRRAVGAG